MYKKFISLFLSLLMISCSINIAHAAASTAEVSPESWFSVRGNGSKYTAKSEKESDRRIFACGNSEYLGNRFMGYIRFDLTNCLKQLYFADSVTFSINPEKTSSNKETSFDLSIISDGLENYDVDTITYNEVIDSGMYNDFPIFYHADNAGTVDVHTTGNIKSNIIKALESGNNNTIVIKVSNKDNKSVILLPESIKLNIIYNTSSATDSAYCSQMANKFDINSVDGILSGTVNSDFDLPLFYKGIEILWSSNNDAIKIPADDDQRAVVTKSESSSIPVTLSAAFTDKSLSTLVIRNFNLSVAQIEPIDIAADKFNNTYKVSDENYGAITKKLNLATEFEGYSVSWVSSNNSVVDAITGEVNASKDADIPVSLTPTISSDGSSRTLNTINVTVKKDITISVNLAFASAGTLISDGRIISDDTITAYPAGRFGVINFDLTPYIAEIYLAKSVKLNMKSACYSANKNDPLDLAIISDGIEEYADLSHNHIQAVNAGMLAEMPVIYHADAIGNYGTPHTTEDIKDIIIKEIETGNDNILAVRLTTTQGVASLQRDLSLEIKYEPDASISNKYYEEILKSFDIEREADITSDAIDDSFTLPTFYKGSKISWTSDKENITINSDGMASVKKSADSDVFVTLTATLSCKDGSSYQKTFTLKVLKKDYIDVLADSFNETYRVSSEDYSEITKYLTLNKTFEGNAVSWVSSNEDVVKAETGRVIRSETEDIPVTLTPTIFYGGESRVLNPINIMVKKITATTKTITAQPGTIKTWEVSNTEIYTDDGKYIGFMNFDFTECLQELYLANTVILTVKSNVWSGSNDNKFSLEIIPDSKEIYTDFEGDNYSATVAGGILSDGIEILSATTIGSNGNANGTHKTSDIKSHLIEALESGDNNKISIRLVLAEDVESSNVSVLPNPELEIKYDASQLTN